MQQLGRDILFRDSLTGEIHLHVHAKSFENYQLIFVSSGICVLVAVTYGLQTTKKNGVKAAYLFKEFSKFVYPLSGYQQ